MFIKESSFGDWENFLITNLNIGEYVMRSGGLEWVDRLGAYEPGKGVGRGGILGNAAANSHGINSRHISHNYELKWHSSRIEVALYEFVNGIFENVNNLMADVRHPLKSD